jgi:hypothetical protein
MVREVYLAAHLLRVETIFKACSNYLAQQLNANNCLSMCNSTMIGKAA